MSGSTPKNDSPRSRRSSKIPSKKASPVGAANNDAVGDFDFNSFVDNFGDAYQYESGFALPQDAQFDFALPGDLSLGGATRRASLGLVNQPLVAMPHEQPGFNYLDQSFMPQMPDSLIDPRFLDQNYEFNPNEPEEVHIQPANNSSLFVEDEVHALGESDNEDRLKPAAAPRTRKVSGGSGDSSDSFADSPEKSDRSRRQSDSSAGSDDSYKKNKRNRVRNVDGPYKAEKPKADPNKPWIRINSTTKGETPRPGKINQYDAAKVYNTPAPLPLGDWNGSRTEFKYTANGEFAQRTFKARELRDYIYEYPKDPSKHIGLVMWIQRAPTDSARRYPSASASQCRFRDCPIQREVNGNIIHGHYRVAFDEKYSKYKGNYDPFLVSGYAHLYCVERFLNFSDICKKFDVRVDKRALTSEPNHKFAATLANTIEGEVAGDFIWACKIRKLRNEFPNYPDHSHYKGGAPKPHEDTLTYLMNSRKCEKRPPAQLKQFRNRGVGQTTITIHLGDLEMIAMAHVAKRQAKKDKKRKTTKRKRKNQAESDSEEEQSDLEEEIETPRKRVKKTAFKPKNYDDEDDSDDASDSPVRPPRQGTRRSDRTRKPIRTYAEPGDNSPTLPEAGQIIPPMMQDTINVYPAIPAMDDAQFMQLCQQSSMPYPQMSAPYQAPAPMAPMIPAADYQPPIEQFNGGFENPVVAGPDFFLDLDDTQKLDTAGFGDLMAEFGLDAKDLENVPVDPNLDFSLDFDPTWTANNGETDDGEIIDPNVLEQALQRRRSSFTPSQISDIARRLSRGLSGRLSSGSGLSARRSFRARKVLTGEPRRDSVANRRGKASPKKISIQDGAPARRCSARLNSEKSGARNSLGSLFSA